MRYTQEEKKVEEKEYNNEIFFLIRSFYFNFFFKSISQIFSGNNIFSNFLWINMRLNYFVSFNDNVSKTIICFFMFGGKRFSLYAAFDKYNCCFHFKKWENKSRLANYSYNQYVSRTFDGRVWPDSLIFKKRKLFSGCFRINSN